MIERLFSFLLLAILSAAALANPCATGGRPFPVGEGSGMGGTGLQADQADGSGIGGTGHRDGSGAGGTGQQVRNDGDGSGAGGTGVVGIITGFGSICVNELEIHYDAKTSVSVNGESSRSDQLAVGQMVAVRAEGKGASLHAKDIQVRHTLVGRVEAVNPDGQFKVWGQWVNPPLMTEVQPGSRIKVSGYRADSKHVVASRIDPALAGEPDLLTGEVEWTQAGEAMVSGVLIRLPAGGERVQAGQEIRASGRAEAGGMRAERIEPDGLRGFVDKMDRINMKDRIQPANQSGKLRVGGVEFTLDANTQVKGGSAKELRPGRLVKVEARQKDGRAVVERIEIRDEAGTRGHEKPNGEAAKAKHSATKETRDSSRIQESEDHGDSREADGDGAPERGEPHDDAANELTRDGKSERPEQAEKAEKPEAAEKLEKPERDEKVEKPEKVEKLERPEKLEKPEKPEKIEKPERPERDDD